MKFLTKTPYSTLISAALLLGLAPFVAEPHVVEKLKMLLNGSLNRPIDIFDLFFHLVPTIMLFFKWFVERRRNGQAVA